jgi:MFS family permease
LGGVISDRILARTGNLKLARCNLICLSFIGSLICLIPVFYTNNLTVLTASLAAAFFCLELSIGPVWSVPMDIAPYHAGTASGIMNTGAAIAAIISPTVFGYVVELTGSWAAPFVASIGLLLVGAAATFFMRPDRTLDVGAVPDQLHVACAPARQAPAGLAARLQQS